MALKKYHFSIEHRPRTQHRNADGLSKRTNDYKKTRTATEGTTPNCCEMELFITREITQASTGPMV